MMTPEWMLDNPFITRGYRMPASYRGIILELFSWHNETLNAWTMIFAGVVAMGVWVVFAPIELPFILLLTSACVCVPTSVLYHLKCNESEECRAFHRHLDITFIGVASVFLTAAFSAYILPSIISLVLVMGCAYTTLAFWYSRHNTVTYTKNHVLQSVATFVGFYLFPIVVASMQTPSQNLRFLLGIVSSLGLGAWMYVKHFPENVVPTLDYIGNSHQLMHLCLIVAHIFEFSFLLKMQEKNKRFDAKV